MHPYFRPDPPPTEPFRLGPFQVVPDSLVYAPNTRYRISYKGIILDDQLSRPNLDQCGGAALRAFASKRIDGHTLAAIRRDLAEAGQDFPQPTLRLVHARRGFNNAPPQPPTDIMKRCRTCGEEKALRQFYRNPCNSIDHRDADCRACVNSGRAKQRSRL